MSGYAFDNAWKEARRRLGLLEALDPATVGRMERIGVEAGSVSRGRSRRRLHRTVARRQGGP
jgi:hypothetical protein